MRECKEATTLCCIINDEGNKQLAFRRERIEIESKVIPRDPTRTEQLTQSRTEALLYPASKPRTA
eukprot:2180188-Prymnesium_polylepis.1